MIDSHYVESVDGATPEMKQISVLFCFSDIDLKFPIFELLVSGEAV